MTRLVVIARHCTERRGQKPRPAWFDKGVALATVQAEVAPEDLVVVYDCAAPSDLPAYATRAAQGGARVVVAPSGSDRLCMRAATHVALTSDLADDDIVYFVEDDYVHRPGWRRVLLEAFEHGVADYITLYDHPDKYPTAATSIRLTPSCHWRAAASTTNTWACRVTTLKRDLAIHKHFLGLPGHHVDHEKFVALGAASATLATALPGWSTHCHEPLLSPAIDWAPSDHLESLD